MLSKVGEKISLDVKGGETLTRDVASLSVAGSSTPTIYMEYTNNSVHNEIITGEGMYSGTDYKASSLKYVILTSSLVYVNIGGFNVTEPVPFGPVTLEPGQTIRIVFTPWTNGSSYEAWSAKNVHVKMVVQRTAATLPKNSDLVGKPKEVKPLGSLGLATIWGVYNNTFYAQEPTTKAVTGNITPGNFVGYLNIGGYKIPYYL